MQQTQQYSAREMPEIESEIFEPHDIPRTARNHDEYGSDDFAFYVLEIDRF